MVLTPQEMADLMPDTSKVESQERGMESSVHYMQLALLVACLEWHWRRRNDFFIGANLTFCYSRQQILDPNFHSPDFFVVKNTEKRPRYSWVAWAEDGRYPNIIIELLAASTAKFDRNERKILYQNQLRTPEYFWFDPENLEFSGFRLICREYQAIVVNEYGRLWSDVLKLYLGIHDGKLRYFTPDGQLVATPEEAALQAQEQAAQAQERVERLSNQLRALGIEPE
ncbi:MAG: Uma2 family endonuclease [Microcoleus sp. CSU_2_2]|nr:Uma2 family endonuclease [Microcoleus sp. SU_5_3]NJS11259.1 Uma2 family endonuclease [Microcoleus sp. CSU_2_2]